MSTAQAATTRNAPARPARRAAEPAPTPAPAPPTAVLPEVWYTSKSGLKARYLVLRRYEAEILYGPLKGSQGEFVDLAADWTEQGFFTVPASRVRPTGRHFDAAAGGDPVEAAPPESEEPPPF